MICLRVLCLLLLFAVSVSAQQLAFPTARGWGRFSTGGRGGVVCHVDTLGNTNTGNQIAGSLHYRGTFRYCLLRSGARTVVFDVSGTIADASQLRASNGNMTIAAQTAPGDGILIKQTEVQLNAADMIVRYLVVRTGPNVPTPSSWGAMEVINSTPASDVIVDHGSFTWSTDDMAQAWGSHDVTYQWNIIANALATPTYAKNIMIGGNATRISLLNNLMANAKDRAPYIQSGDVQMVNNLIYNVNANANIAPVSAPVHVEFIGNYWLRGPSSGGTYATSIRNLGPCWTRDASNNCTWLNPNDGGDSEMYYSGEFHSTLRTSDTPAQDAHVQQGGGGTDAFGTYPAGWPTRSTPFGTYPAVSHTSASQAYTDVLAKAGPRVPVLNSIDEAIRSNVINLTGNITLTNPTFPTISEVSRAEGYDTDYDGIPNAWETACSGAISAATTNGGLSTSDGADGAELVTTTGYSKLEHYLNEVAGDYAPDTCGGLSTGDTTAPTSVSITAPSASATVSGSSVTYSATASDETAMDRVEFYQNGALIASDSSSPYSITWNTTTLPDGEKGLHVIAYDMSQNSTQSATVNVTVDNILGYTAVHTASAPTINGTLTEFANANPVQLDGMGGLTPLNVTDLRLMWDSTALYIGALTTDTYLEAATTGHDNAALFNDDAIEIVIDTDNDGVWETTDYKFIINAQNVTFDARNLSDTTYEPTYTSQVVRVGDLDGVSDDTSWAVEIAIPWAQMGGISAAADQVYGINVQIDDDDGTRTAYRWSGSINVLADAQDVTLGPDSGTDTTDPTNVVVIDPLEDQFISGTYTIEATAQDNVGVASVEFYEGTNLLCTDTTPSGGVFSCDWDTTGESEGSYALKVTACDTAGTPNCADSAVVTVTVDHTAPSNPSSLTASTLSDDGGVSVSLNWAASTDASGTPSYGIERCQGVSCSSFAEVGTSATNSHLDGFLSELTTYCYRVRGYDAALNPSAAYSNTACVETLDIVPFIPSVSDLTRTAGATIILPPVVTGVTRTASPTLTGPPQVTGLTRTASPTITFPPVVTGVE